MIKLLNEEDLIGVPIRSSVSQSVLISIDNVNRQLIPGAQGLHADLGSNLLSNLS
jgi:hypothetical protein